MTSSGMSGLRSRRIMDSTTEYVRFLLRELGLEYVPPGGAQRGTGTWTGFLLSSIQSQYIEPGAAASAIRAQVYDRSPVFVTFCKAGNLLEIGF